MTWRVIYVCYQYIIKFSYIPGKKNSYMDNLEAEHSCMRCSVHMCFSKQREDLCQMPIHLK
uniref:Uncharacterized protein n=1 Tax=Arundo donax TaxID=35708 RepID=A0A0A9F1C3_ARUDO